MFAHTAHFLGSNEELINRVLPPMPRAGGWNSQAELSPNTQTQDTHHTLRWTHMMAGAHIAESVWPDGDGTQPGAACRSGPWSAAAKRGEVAVAAAVGERPLQFSRTNFSHGIWVLHRHPKSIGCAYRLGFGQARGKMRVDLPPDIWWGTEKG